MDTSDLGKILRDLRGKESLRDAAKRAGISHTYLSIVEKGYDLRSGSPVKPTPETLKSLSKAYNFSYDDLMRMAGYISEEEQNNSVADKLAEYIDMELTNEEIKKRITFKVDTIELSDEEVDEFIAFVRAKRIMKKKPSAASRSEEL